MNSIQFLSSRVERVISGAQQQQQQQLDSDQNVRDSSDIMFRPQKLGHDTSSLENIINPGQLTDYSPEHESRKLSSQSEQSSLSSNDTDSVSSLDSSLSETKTTNPSILLSSGPVSSVSGSPPKTKGGRPWLWFWLVPISLLIRLFKYIYTALASTLGAYDETKGMAAVSASRSGSTSLSWDHSIASNQSDFTRAPKIDEEFEPEEPVDARLLRRPSLRSATRSSSTALQSSIAKKSECTNSTSSSGGLESSPDISDDSLQHRRSVRIRLSQTKPPTSPNPSNYSSSPEASFTYSSSEDGDTSASDTSSLRSFSKRRLSAKSVKSPTSPRLRPTKYPHSLPPPRPLIPRNPPPKTLILDLDETLIHSMSKGSMLAASHMVEVKLDKQHAILYYIYKRPFCDLFLEKVSAWYNVVVFTASVQEYADPVIDLLEQNQKYFKGRYYRQHCTFRNGGYVKDISVVEADLSKVMIIDNSPISYLFHEDNAIGIEGWINDPSDHDLLHLLPFLNAMRYVTDVRTLISLRAGESAFSNLS
ncbi:NLI interacting factor-like phosphatase-domain-containing protein [Lipomyces oligophaga]|uniref:NLI interacting factor-like phosphatase-domain-containing protein n=1 Tax=Lipomyces oligophaga TaxID=45792 RepID=UPI0034CEF2DA